MPDNRERCRTSALILQQRDSQIAAQDAEIERLKHQWATRETQRLYNKREHSLSQDQLYASVAAADAWDAQMLVQFKEDDEICPVCHREEPHGSHWGSCPWAKYHNIRAAYTATRTQENENGTL